MVIWLGQVAPVMQSGKPGKRALCDRPGSMSYSKSTCNRPDSMSDMI